MKLVAKQDIDAPIDQVFAEVSDFDRFLHGAVQRGATIERTDTLAVPGVGMTWDAAFDLRGRRRETTVRMTDYDRPNGMRFEAESAGLDATCWIELVALSPQATRMKLHTELTPNTLSARLLVQSLKLAKASLVTRMEARLAKYGRAIEDRARRQA
ncbi:SRPBCC family protein [Pseudooceanicola sp. LIPI14-2-Ac024]|uniref:SRPBCC family protein n=1 Tax=Pseudooceanicola sp. LIPI14-2-Ac024 TaxID=3344875 RepID=UPI0035CF6E2D